MFVFLVSLFLVCQLWALENAGNALSHKRLLHNHLPEEELRPIAREMAEDDRVNLPVLVSSVCCAAMIGGCAGATLLPLECASILKMGVGAAASVRVALRMLELPTVAHKLNALYVSLDCHAEEFLNR